MAYKKPRITSGNLWIHDEIRRAEDSGIPTSVNGVPYHSSDSGSPPVFAENDVYMEDFINDDDGRIVQVNFEQIRHFQ